MRSSSVRIGRVGYDFAFLYTDKLLILETKIFEIKKSEIFLPSRNAIKSMTCLHATGVQSGLSRR